MKPLNRALVGSIGVAALAFGALIAALMVRYGSQPLVVTPWISLSFILIGLWLLIGGRAVRNLKAHKETWVSPVGAARIAVFARSSAYVLSGCTGFLMGVAGVGFTRMWAPIMAFAAWSALAGAVTALFACLSAVVVERWCRDVSSDEDGDGGLRGSKRSAPNPRVN